jgi:hypothetical protein
MRRFVSAIACAWAVLALAASAATAASAPLASTGNATAITSTSATLKGAVNPEGQATTYYFEYGTTTSYGSDTATSSAGSGTANVSVSAPLRSLAPAKTYHYRLVATNGSGTTLGSDVSFTTPNLPVPLVVTGYSKGVTETSATLTGTIDARGQPTSYVFQYGTSSAYGRQTSVANAGSATTNVSVSAPVSGLTPDTTYHYRLAATSAAGTTYGTDVSFKTGSTLAGVTIVAQPATITFGQRTTLSGRVQGSGASRAPVTLQTAPGAGGPWTRGATSTASSTGAYSFARIAPASSTYYRVVSKGTASAVVGVLVRFRVAVQVSGRHPLPGSMVRFHGRVRPAHNGLRVLVQRLGPHGRWRTVKRTRLRAAGGAASFYSVRVRIMRSGRYRVVVEPDASHAAGYSRAIRIRLR